MSDPIPPAGAAPADEQAIRERVRELTAQMLAGGTIDPEGVKQVVRAIGGSAGLPPAPDEPAAREAFVATLRGLDEALQRSAQAAHEALQALAEHGAAYTDNDLKNAFAGLQQLQRDYVAVADHLADATTGNIRRELVDLALHAQRVGTDAGVRMAQLASEFANRIGGSYRARSPAAGLDAAREYGANLTLLTSGMLAGLADALRQQSDRKKPG